MPICWIPSWLVFEQMFVTSVMPLIIPLVFAASTENTQQNLYTHAKKGKHPKVCKFLQKVKGCYRRNCFNDHVYENVDPHHTQPVAHLAPKESPNLDSTTSHRRSTLATSKKNSHITQTESIYSIWSVALKKERKSGSISMCDSSSCHLVSVT